VLSYALGLGTDDAQTLLAEADVDVRSDLVLAHLRQRQRQLGAGISPGFPPDFSRN